MPYYHKSMKSSDIVTIRPADCRWKNDAICNMPIWLQVAAFICYHISCFRE